MEATIRDKAERGIKTYLERQGFEIMEEGWAHGSDRIDFIADDEGELAFIDCRINDNDGHGFADDKVDREAFERLAASYLTEHGEIPDSRVRFDVVSMLILSEGKGLLRHHRNALSVGD